MIVIPFIKKDYYLFRGMKNPPTEGAPARAEQKMCKLKTSKKLYRVIRIANSTIIFV